MKTHYTYQFLRYKTQTILATVMYQESQQTYNCECLLSQLTGRLMHVNPLPCAAIVLTPTDVDATEDDRDLRKGPSPE